MTDRPASGKPQELAHGHGDEDDHGNFGPGSEERLGRSDRFYRPVNRKIVDWLPLGTGGAALDAGCGTAGFAELLAEKVGDAGTIDAADTSAHLLEHNRARLANDKIGLRIRFHESAIQDLPFSDGSFDLVWSSRAVHHLADQLAGLRELARVLKPGGTLAIREGGIPARFMPDMMTLIGTGLNERLSEAGKKWMAGHVHHPGSDGHTPYPFGWTQLLRDAGLTHVSVRTFIHEFMPPFSEEQQAHMLNELTQWAEHGDRGEFLSETDRSALSRLIDPDDSEYVFNRPDLHYVEGITVYTGKA